MRRIADQPILTLAEMRAAEQAAAQSGASLSDLMRAAGEAVGEQVRRLATGAPVLILCGPGNNGGDGYVAAAALARAGHPVRVAASGEPCTELAKTARASWSGQVETLADAAPAQILVDAVFGIGPARPLPVEIETPLRRLLAASNFGIAVDQPSGAGTDDGDAPDYGTFDLTLAVGALKPVHVLQPSASRCGGIRILDIGLRSLDTSTRVIAPAVRRMPGPEDHKYTRGMVAVVAGPMEGAARLAAVAALHAGAGYAAIFGGSGGGGPDALVHRELTPEALHDPRIGAIVIGPGLGRGDPSRSLLDRVIEDDRAALVIDGDALHLLDLDRLARRKHPVVLTPHSGEFAALFGNGEGSRLDRSRAAALRAGGVVVFKGATTVLSDGATTIVSPNGSPWLSTAGSGDVLAGSIAAMLAARGARDPLMDAADGVCLHAEAARRLRPAFLADDLARALRP